MGARFWYSNSSVNLLDAKKARETLMTSLKQKQKLKQKHLFNWKNSSGENPLKHTAQTLKTCQNVDLYSLRLFVCSLHKQVDFL